MRLASVRIFVGDVANAATFYEDIVGLARTDTISFVQYPAEGAASGGS